MARTQISNYKKQSVKLLDEVAANAAAATRTTDWIDTVGANLVSIECHFTHSTATVVTITVQQLSVDGSTVVTKQTRSTSNDLSDWAETKTVSGDADWVSDIPTSSQKVKFVYSTTGGGASDLLTMYLHEVKMV